MKKSYFKYTLAALLLVNITSCVLAATKPQVIRPSTPIVSESLKPIIVDYRNGNYIQSMLKLEELVKKEPENTYANYYLALTYTRLGKKEDAEKFYNRVITLNSNMSLRYYSQKALACLDDPTSQQCTDIKSTNQLVKKTNESSDGAVQEDDDITKFIKSGQKIHPAAVDSITKDRMERRIQAEEYLRKQQQEQTGEKQSSLVPTQEEIIAAYNTLKKAGLDPYNLDTMGYNIALNQNANDFDLYSILTNSNSQTAQTLFLNQLIQNNNITNYGI